MSGGSGLSAGRPSSRTGSTVKTLHDLADSQETMRVNFNLTKEKHTKLKLYAIKQDKTVTEVLTEYVDSIID